MRIGELARRTGVGAHQLRYYETRELIGPSRRGNGYREYDEDAVATVLRIRALLDAGLSTDDIATVLPCASGAAPDLDPCPDLLATLRARLAGIDERLDTLSRSRTALVGYLAAADARSAQDARSARDARLLARRDDVVDEQVGGPRRGDVAAGVVAAPADHPG